MNRYKGIFILLVITGLVLWASADLSAQCSMCKARVESGGKLEVGRNLNNAILYLMAVPYLALGFIFRTQIISFFRSLRSK